MDTFDDAIRETQEVNIVHTPLAPFSCLNPRAPEFKYPAPIPVQPSSQSTTLSAQPSVPTHLIVSGPTNKAAIPPGPSCPVLTSTSGLPSVLPPLLGTAMQGRPGLSESPPVSIVATETESVPLQEINVQLPPADKEQQDLEQAGEDLGGIEGTHKHISYVEGAVFIYLEIILYLARLLVFIKLANNASLWVNPARIIPF